jgi:predicted porin
MNRSAVGDPASLLSKSILLLGTLSAAAGVAQAQSADATATYAGAPPALSSSGTPADESLTWHGITLYGIIDVGIQDQTHGAPISDYFPGGSSDIVQKNSNHSINGVTPSNLSQSRIGLQGNEPIYGDWSGVFKLETFFNPQSGDISDGLKSLVQNNGKSAASGTQNTNLDTSVAGQAFQQSFAGFSSKTFGTITFGRQNTILADGIAKYDPNYASQAFSLIGLSGTTAGGGDTEDRRLDDSLKYVANYEGLVHFGALYKFNQSTGAAGSAFQVTLGADYAGLSIDAYYSKVRDAISASSLSAAQVGDLAGLNLSINQTLSATVSDNTAWAFMGLYDMGALKFFAGFEHIQYANPETPLTAGVTFASYTFGFVSNTAYPTDKEMQVFWGGVRYTVIPDLDLVAAGYGYHQNSYGTGATAGCNSAVAGTCSGTTEAYSLLADYRLSKRFDVYAGSMFTEVLNGQANGYAFQRTDITTTTGVRFKF